MTSYFRQKIANRIVSKCRADSVASDRVAKHLRVHRRKCDHFEFVLPLQTPGFNANADQRVLPSNSIPVSDLRNGVDQFKDGECITATTLDDNNLIFRVEKRDLIQRILDDIVKHPSSFWRKSCLLRSLQPRKVVAEFSSPNIAKPFHAGHLRSTLIGNFVANLKRALGHSVVSVNYLGDWGTQFGLLGTGFEMCGSEEELLKDPVRHLFQVYVSVNEAAAKDISIHERAKIYFSKMEKGDASVLKQWDQFRQLSVADLRNTYKRLGVSFDAFDGESMYGEKAAGVVEDLRKSGLMSEVNGAGVVQLESSSGSNNKTKLVTVRKSDGSTLYLSRDIAAAIDRKEKYNFDEMLYVVENGQSDHFSSLRQILCKMGKDWYSSIYHVKFGRIHNLSTRRGNVVFLSDILEEAKDRMLQSMATSPNTRPSASDYHQVADVLGTTAVVVNDLKARRSNDYDFSWEKVLHVKGSSGLQLQYTHARLCSLQKNCGVEMPGEMDASLLTADPEAINLVRWLSRFDEVLLDADEALEPCVVVQYLFQLCHFINGANVKLTVKGQQRDVAQARLVLFMASKAVLHQGMKILGLQPLEEM